MKLIIGLGNPGKTYERTRHNIGFVVADKITYKILNTKYKLQKKSNSELAEATIDGVKIILAKPLTFMNESGVAVRALLDFYKLKPTDIIVVHDDKDIPLGEYKIQTNRGPAGHNGVKSMIEHLGTQNFTRVRIGIATLEMDKYEDKADFVLGKFGKDEMKTLDEVMDKVMEETNHLISNSQ